MAFVAAGIKSVLNIVILMLSKFNAIRGKMESANIRIYN